MFTSEGPKQTDNHIYLNLTKLLRFMCSQTFAYLDMQQTLPLHCVCHRLTSLRLTVALLLPLLWSPPPPERKRNLGLQLDVCLSSPAGFYDSLSTMWRWFWFAVGFSEFAR